MSHPLQSPCRPITASFNYGRSRYQCLSNSRIRWVARLITTFLPPSSIVGAMFFFLSLVSETRLCAPLVTRTFHFHEVQLAVTYVAQPVSPQEPCAVRYQQPSTFQVSPTLQGVPCLSLNCTRYLALGTNTSAVNRHRLECNQPWRQNNLLLRHRSSTNLNQFVSLTLAITLELFDRKHNTRNPTLVLGCHVHHLRCRRARECLFLFNLINQNRDDGCLSPFKRSGSLPYVGGRCIRYRRNENHEAKPKTLMFRVNSTK